MKSKGFTLIELAVVLAIIAVLAAVLTPMVTGYLDQARIARASADVRTIADAVKLYNRDTGRYPIYDTNALYVSDTTGAIREIGSSAGNTPAAGSGWTLSGTTLTSSSLESYLNNNSSGLTGGAFPKAAFRGPYIGTIDSDPWANKYLLNSTDLVRSSTSHAYVLSAGPNGTVETTRDVATTSALTAGGDDIIAVIR